MVIDSGPAAIELFPIAQSQITVLVSLFGLAPTITGGGAVAARTLAIPRNAVVVSTFPAMVRVVHAEWFAAHDRGLGPRRLEVDDLFGGNAHRRGEDRCLRDGGGRREPWPE